MEAVWSASSSGDPDSGSLRITRTSRGGADPGAAARLKAQMQADGLRPLDPSSDGSGEGDEDSDRKEHGEAVAVWPEETLLQVGDYLRLSVSRILHFTSPAISLLGHK